PTPLAFLLLLLRFSPTSLLPLPPTPPQSPPPASRASADPSTSPKTAVEADSFGTCRLPTPSRGHPGMLAVLHAARDLHCERALHLPHVLPAVVRMLACAVRVLACSALLDAMPKLVASAHTTLVSAFSRIGRYKDAVAVFRRMVDSGMRLALVTWGGAKGAAGGGAGVAAWREFSLILARRPPSFPDVSLTPARRDLRWGLAERRDLRRGGAGGLVLQVADVRPEAVLRYSVKLSDGVHIYVHVRTDWCNFAGGVLLRKKRIS
ncbi:hypothetical protein EJB05_05591, partial [Eragrostis curvula]